MNLAICTIQRDRGQWLREWVTFHSLIGFNKFYIYLHKCSDNSAQVVTELARHFDIKAYTLTDDIHRPQLAAYQHCYSEQNTHHDWIAFIDGDEFLFTPNEIDISNELKKNQYEEMSAIGVYWACFGSSNYINEPDGLITENYRFRAPKDFSPNRHIKSIVRGGMGDAFSVTNNSHLFNTSKGTFDTSKRIITSGHTKNEPCWDRLRINHYATQSYSFFKQFKQTSGAPDAGARMVRSDDWWVEYDRNEIYDESLDHVRPYLRDMMK